MNSTDNFQYECCVAILFVCQSIFTEIRECVSAGDYLSIKIQNLVTHSKPSNTGLCTFLRKLQGIC